MRIYDKSSFDALLNLKAGAEPICTTDKYITLFDILNIDGKLYSPCAISRKKDICKVEELNVNVLNDDPDDIEMADNIRCPYCESELRDTFELPDEKEEHECPFCGSTFAYQRIITAYYDIQPVKKNEDVLELVGEGNELR